MGLLEVPVILLLLNTLTAAAVEPPTFSEERGLREAPFSLELSAEAGDTIWVSLDGGSPDTVYAEPLFIDGTTVVRALVEDASGASSEALSHTFVFTADVLTQSVMDGGIVNDPEYGPRVAATLAELPTLSVSYDGSLTQVETLVSFEYFDPDGDLSVQAECGAARVGGHSLNYPKNNLRLYFRQDYGVGKLDADFFADLDATGVPSLEEHDSLDLRGGSHDSVFYLGARGQYLRNMWMDETELEMGHEAPHGRFAHLYLNGEYTGLYHLRERFDSAFLAEHRGGTEDDYEAVNGGRVVDGSGAAWANIAAAYQDYDAFRAWVNTEQYFDYIVLNLFAANTWDWNPNQNWQAAGSISAREDWVFHSSDSDICLYYGVDHWVLAQYGPAYTLSGLLAEAHPDFMVGLMDALHRNLEGDGPLSPERASGRYARLSPLIEDAVVAEAARWGGGGWDPDTVWVTERDYLTDTWLPERGQELLADVSAAGWMPLPAPELSLPPGEYTPGTALSVSVPEGVDAQLLVRFDGGDPRLPGGEVATEAMDSGSLLERSLDQGLALSARLYRDGTWGPVEEPLWEAPGDAAVVLNEWNAVQRGKTLKDDGEDAAFGVIDGNGGAWVELLVLQDGTDLRGARLVSRDLYGDRGTLTFTEDDLLADLQAGTLFTVSTDLPEDPAYDPDAGDWRFHLRATADGDYVRTEGFVVTPHDWRATLLGPDGRVFFGPAGEGRGPVGGLSSREVGVLATTPELSLRPDSAYFIASTLSTYGSPNVWEDGEQDLSELRGEVEDSGDDGGGGATGGDDSGDDGAVDDGTGGVDEPAPDGVDAGSSGCGCSTGGSPGGLGILGLLGLTALARRRRRDPEGGGRLPGAASRGAVYLGALLAAVFTSGCVQGGVSEGDTGSSVSTPADDTAGGAGSTTGEDDTEDSGTDCVPHPERCNGEDDDCDGLVDEPDPDLVDGLPFYSDADGDGFGDEENVLTACALDDGLVLEGGDCDDGDATVFPGAVELCDGVDQDCDGGSEDGPGLAEACPADSCLALLEADPTATDGAYWLALPTGTVTSVWCDMANGGWTLGFLRNSASTGSQGDFGAGEEGLDAIARDPAEASASSTPAMGWQDLNELAYEELLLAAYAAGAGTFRSEAIPREDLRIAFGDDGYLLYGSPSPYVWCGGDASYTDGRVGAVNNPEGAPAGCRGHGSLGSGWDFSTSLSANAGLTLCGGDGSAIMMGSWAGAWISYGTAGGAQAIWVR